MSRVINPYLGRRECLFCRTWFAPRPGDAGQRYCKRHRVPKCDTERSKGKDVPLECEICHLRWNGPKGTKRCPLHANQLFVRRGCVDCRGVFWVHSSDLPYAFGDRCVECRPSVGRVVPHQEQDNYERPGKFLTRHTAPRQSQFYLYRDVGEWFDNVVNLLEAYGHNEEPP